MSSLENQIRHQLERCVSGQCSLDEFRNWFVPVSLDIEGCGNPNAIKLAYEIDAALGEASSGQWSDRGLLEELAGIVPCQQYRFVYSTVDHPQEITLSLGADLRLKNLAAGWTVRALAGSASRTQQLEYESLEMAGVAS
jgi:hypothetical protein